LLSKLDGKWKILIMYHLLNGEQRPSELERLITGVKRQVLTQQLKELEADGLIVKTSFPEVPPRVEYRLSSFGQQLEPVLDQLHDLGRYYAQHVRQDPNLADGNCRKL
jgi:DNA-binding HxlR family transcriptional regulator